MRAFIHLSQFLFVPGQRLYRYRILRVFLFDFLTQGKLRGETWAEWPKVPWLASDRAGTRAQDFGGDPVLPATSPHIPQPNILATLWPGRPSALRQGAVRGAWGQQSGMAVWAGWGHVYRGRRGRIGRVLGREGNVIQNHLYLPFCLVEGSRLQPLEVAHNKSPLI